jgi:hypothetical protein
MRRLLLYRPMRVSEDHAQSEEETEMSTVSSGGPSLGIFAQGFESNHPEGFTCDLNVVKGLWEGLYKSYTHANYK